MVLNVQWTMTFIWNNRRAKSHCLRPNSVKIVNVFLVIGTSNGYRPQPTRSAHWTKYIYIYILLTEQWYGRKWWIRVCNPDECCEPDVCCDSNERCEHYVTKKRCGKCHKFSESVEHLYSQYSIRVSKAAQRQYLYWPNDVLK